MKHTPRPQSISWFQDHYRGGRLELRPPFQRKPVWTAKQRCALIESILLDIPIPEVYVQVTTAPDGTEQYGVVDGQQRLRTILQFIGIERTDDQTFGEDNNSFLLDQLTEKSPHYMWSFSEIRDERRKAFFQYEICVRFLYTEDVSQVEDVFKRLNKFAMPLKAQELRNATFHGPFARLSEELANDEYWAVNRIVTPASIRRMADIEMMSDLLIGLLHGPQGGSARILDEYYQKYEQFEEEFPEQQRVRRTFGSTLDTVRRLFPRIGDAPRWSNRADFYSLFVAIGTQLANVEISRRSERALSKALIEFAHAVDEKLRDPASRDGSPASSYASAIEKGSNDKARRADRHEALQVVISAFAKQPT